MSHDGLAQEAELFVHVAQIAAAAAGLSARASADLRLDLRLLRAELARERLRPGVVLAMVDSVTDDLVPHLNRPAGGCLLAARPGSPGPRLASA
ncbi:hypothetical protein [Nocardioides sp. CFH 31398]|uniref:hypothetical protein n=1 Tax=Nocardioides sp. CFH 31398 TaxID=2919579 RepID=UPI001F0640AA|nr:hypothetical protein [Nocardioides sp. CFH 31398]MCH1865663.1 hypothetical protein [Nocardioides sp. CFH 31398]